MIPLLPRNARKLVSNDLKQKAGDAKGIMEIQRENGTIAKKEKRSKHKEKLYMYRKYIDLEHHDPIPNPMYVRVVIRLLWDEGEYFFSLVSLNEKKTLTMLSVYVY